MKYLGIARKEKGQIVMPDAFQGVEGEEIAHWLKEHAEPYPEP